jgi:hypothetical protein
MSTELMVMLLLLVVGGGVWFYYKDWKYVIPLPPPS